MWVLKRLVFDGKLKHLNTLNFFSKLGLLDCEVIDIMLEIKCENTFWLSNFS